jgi:hypothetical protein
MDGEMNPFASTPLVLVQSDNALAWLTLNCCDHFNPLAFRDDSALALAASLYNSPMKLEPLPERLVEFLGTFALKSFCVDVVAPVVLSSE